MKFALLTMTVTRESQQALDFTQFASIKTIYSEPCDKFTTYRQQAITTKQFSTAPSFTYTDFDSDYCQVIVFTYSVNVKPIHQKDKTQCESFVTTLHTYFSEQCISLYVRQNTASLYQEQSFC